MQAQMQNGLTTGTVLVVLFLLLPIAVVADGKAGGAGGLIVGNRVTEHPFLEQYRVESNTLDLSTSEASATASQSAA